MTAKSAVELDIGWAAKLWSYLKFFVYDSQECCGIRYRMGSKAVILFFQAQKKAVRTSQRRLRWFLMRAGSSDYTKHRRCARKLISSSQQKAERITSKGASVLQRDAMCIHMFFTSQRATSFSAGQYKAWKQDMLKYLIWWGSWYYAALQSHDTCDPSIYRWWSFATYS